MFIYSMFIEALILKVPDKNGIYDSQVSKPSYTTELRIMTSQADL